jgi:hypothetical protein
MYLSASFIPNLSAAATAASLASLATALASGDAGFICCPFGNATGLAGCVPGAGLAAAAAAAGFGPDGFGGFAPAGDDISSIFKLE